MDSVPPGRALDAACGTGRHAGHLVALGHTVLGIDITPEMLDRARINVPAASFIRGDLLAHLGWHAPFTDGGGERGFVREHAHSHADYLSAFRAARLEPRDCREPALSIEHVREKRRAFEHVPDAVIEAYVGLPGVLVWNASKL